MEALEVALAAAYAAKVDLDILIDSRCVQEAFEALMDGSLTVPEAGWGSWRKIKELCGGKQHKAWWVSSHGKTTAWQPPEGIDRTWRDAKKWRALNAKADRRATLGLERARAQRGAQLKEVAVEQACLRAERILQRPHLGSATWVWDTES